MEGSVLRNCMLSKETHLSQEVPRKVVRFAELSNMELTDLLQLIINLLGQPVQVGPGDTDKATLIVCTPHRAVSSSHTHDACGGI